MSIECLNHPKRLGRFHSAQNACRNIKWQMPPAGKRRLFAFPFFTLSQPIKYSSSSSCFAHWATSIGGGPPMLFRCAIHWWRRPYIGIFSPFGGRQNAAPGGGGK
ncbi:hypothetical protein niasHT_016428 [Heterodera trifolii]|uniref:Uncharacterized protein n=1 Tax=Heterodera trifolii TaxID=157864 RepID=A0ABD2LJ23_9BILA